tara:strand:- start:1086 stop:2561 length:1476 start_codon:yes stop_codon:yes gene_type:complete
MKKVVLNFDNTPTKYKGSLLSHDIKIFGIDRDPHTIAALIELSHFGSFDSYIEKIKMNCGHTKKFKKSIWYPYNISLKKKYYCKRFVYSNHLPDIIEINNSKEVRSGGVMTTAYKNIQNIQKNKLDDLLNIENELFFTEYFGIFEKNDGYMQNDLVVNEKLIGYINVRGENRICGYAKILGHGDYLVYGIMYHLHFFIMEWLLSKNSFDYLLYGGYFQGTGGKLIQWKKKLLWEPYMMFVNKNVNHKLFNKHPNLNDIILNETNELTKVIRNSKGTCGIRKTLKLERKSYYNWKVNAYTEKNITGRFMIYGPQFEKILTNIFFSNNKNQLHNISFYTGDFEYIQLCIFFNTYSENDIFNVYDWDIIKYENINNLLFLPHKNVFLDYSDVNLITINNLSEGTNGIKKMISVEQNANYNITITGYNKSDALVRLWITDQDGKKIVINNNYKLNKELTTINCDINSETNNIIFIGFLINGKDNDQFVINHFSIS